MRELKTYLTRRRRFCRDPTIFRVAVRLDHTASSLRASGAMRGWTSSCPMGRADRGAADGLYPCRPGGFLWYVAHDRYGSPRTPTTAEPSERASGTSGRDHRVRGTPGERLVHVHYEVHVNGVASNPLQYAVDTSGASLAGVTQADNSS
jgi:hypothetical protein